MHPYIVNLKIIRPIDDAKTTNGQRDPSPLETNLMAVPEHQTMLMQSPIPATKR
jgi:hypothetical protein